MEEHISRIENLEDRLERLEVKIESYFSPDPRRKYVIGVLTMIIVSWTGWVSLILVEDQASMELVVPAVAKVEACEHRLERIESNRFTSSDGLLQYQALLDHNAKPSHEGTAVILERMDKRLERIENQLYKLQ